MASGDARFDPSFEYELEIVGRGPLYVRNNLVYAPLETIESVRLNSLRRALLRLQEFRRARAAPFAESFSSDEIHGRHLPDLAEAFDGDFPRDEIHVLLSEDPAKDFDEQTASLEPVRFVLRGDELLIAMTLWGSATPKPDVYRRALAPLLDGRGASLAGIETDADGNHSRLRFFIGWPISRRVVRDALALGNDVLELLYAAHGGELTPSTTLNLLRAGRWDLLVGQPESQWLDVKREPYDRTKPHWKYELAKDVAAFANSDSGGLIVLGLTATDRGDGEIVTGRHFFPLQQISRQAYRNMAARLIYPRVVGLEIERIQIEEAGPDAGIAVVIVPPQPASARPFLVHGLVRQRNVLGSHIMLPFRQEDETRVLEPAALHARIRLGEDVLAGRIPRSMSSQSGDDLAGASG